MVLVLLSPSKTLDENVRRTGLKMTKPHFQDRAIEIMAELQKYSAVKIGKLMDVSEKLAKLNYDRFQNFADQHKAPAILAYQGDVYVGLNAKDLSDEEIQWSQDHIGILTGLYGVLRPLDAMQAYRLEMGIKLPLGKVKDLYAYWNKDITDYLNAQIKKNKITAVIGCASIEYLSSVKTADLAVPFIQCNFKEMKNGKPVIVALFAKKARGMMARYVVEHHVTDAETLKKFNSAGYKFDKKLSTDNNFVFVR